MDYIALAVGLADNLLRCLQSKLAPHGLYFESAPTVQEANRQLSRKKFYLLIVDLEYLRSIGQASWLECVRNISAVPLIVLSNKPNEDFSTMVRLGADICVSDKWPPAMIAALTFAQFRRYTSYNHQRGPYMSETAPFQKGDIFIDPARRTVKVRERPVSLRPREFSLLLYFMQNPGVVLTAGQICENAWGTDGIYDHGVAQPIRLLRLAIEPDPQHPIYIETIRLIGYRFTAKRTEI